MSLVPPVLALLFPVHLAAPLPHYNAAVTEAAQQQRKERDRRETKHVNKLSTQIDQGFVE